MKKVIPKITDHLSPSELPLTDRQKAYNEIYEGSWPHRRFWVLVVLSTIIASYGLLSNSAAVIIGAMLVAPLMGPILGIALSLVSGDTRLLRASLTAEILGLALAIFIGYSIGIIPLSLGITSEMLARTNPTILDLAIAIASGLAGAYASIQPKVNSALPGVAISVALIPPLATCGLLLSMGDNEKAFGALMLFLANFFSIQLAAAFIFLLYKMHQLRSGVKLDAIHMYLKFFPSAIAIIIIGIFMYGTLARAISERTFKDLLTSTLRAEISARTGGTLESILSQAPSEKGYEVIAVALTPSPFEPTQVSNIEKVLREKVRPDIYLIVRSLQSKDNDAYGQVFQSPEDIEEKQSSTIKRQILDNTSKTIESFLTEIPGSRLDNLQSIEKDGGLRFIVTISTPEAVTPDDVAKMEDAVISVLGKNTSLLVRSILTRDADRNRYIYEKSLESALPLQEEEQTLISNVKSVLLEHIETVTGATLIDLAVDSFENATEVTAFVETPFLITPEQVSEFETDLKTRVDSKISLKVNSQLAGTASSKGWQSFNRNAIIDSEFETR